MKQTNLAMKIMMAVLVVGVLTYMSVYFFLGWHEAVVTTVAYEMTVNAGTSASALLIREEQVVTGGSGGYVDLDPNEGERVAVGDTVATVYRDASGLETRQSLRELESEIEQLNYALSSSSSNPDASKLDDAVLQAIVSLRAAAGSRDLSGLEDCALNLRTMVFKRDYIYSTGSAASGISALIQQKLQEAQALQSSLSRVATTITAPASGVFSGVADGYEDVVDPETAFALMPSDLDALISRGVSAPAGAVGKLITSSTWYLAAALTEEEGKDLTLNKSYAVTFSYDWYGTVDMTLVHISDKEDGRAVYLFSASTALSDTTLLRAQTVDISTRQISGIRVPKQSLRVQIDEVTDEETGETRQEQTTGVFTVVGTQAEFQEVNVLYTEDDFYLVEPVDPDASKRLRAGDDVILNSTGIYDGKVVAA